MTHPFQFQETLLITRPEALKSVVGRETLMVCGAARGMTSVVSYTLYELGYFIGTDLQLNNYEDHAFQRAIIRFVPARKPLAQRQDLRDLIARRNAGQDRWGFKLPDAVQHVEDLPPLLRNPVVVLCIRNPVAVARSIMTRDPGVKGGLGTAMRKGLDAMSALPYLLDRAPHPAIIVDMDAVRRTPGAFVRDIIEVLDLSGDADAITGAISKQGYKPAAPRDGITFHLKAGYHTKPG